MIEIFDFEQGSEEWALCRLGIPTASELHCVLSKGRGEDGTKAVAFSKMRRSYLHRLVGERISGDPAETYNNAHMERGKAMEADARNLYAFQQDATPSRVGFIRSGEKGCSPDSLISDTGMLEIKTRLPHLQIEVLLADKMPPEHKAQVQGSLWIAEREWCDFVSYWPRLPLFVTRVYRDEAYIKQISDAVDAFMEELRAVESRIRQMDGKTSTMPALKQSATILGAG